MKVGLFVGTLFVTALFSLPSVVGQIPLPAPFGQPVPECDPATCDPKVANSLGPGEYRTGSDDVQSILFGHFEDCLQDAPLNTQVPDTEHETDIDCGFMMPTIDTNTPCQQCNVHFKNNRFTMFSSPGTVEFTAEGWRIHHEQGLAETVRFSGAQLTGYWYMSVRSSPDNVPLGAAGAGVMPAVGVYMRMETGRYYLYGNVIAEGDSGTGFGDPQAGGVQGTTVMYNTPGLDNVFEFRINMPTARGDIPSHWFVNDPKQDGFTVTIVPYQVDADAASDSSFTGNEWRIRTGPEWRPRVVVPTANPLVTTHTQVHTFDDYLFFRWSFVSPWGSYDVNPNSLQIQVTGPITLTEDDAIEFVKLKYSIDHDGHFKPVNATWRYNYIDTPLPEGKYTVKASVVNLQETYQLVWTEDFMVGPNGVPEVSSIGGASDGMAGGTQSGGGEADSPGFEAFGLVAAAAAAMVILRRRRA